jgi:tRNA-(MS[2]IO[6]A)-hydroxylase MiaE-like protein
VPDHIADRADGATLPAAAYAALAELERVNGLLPTAPGLAERMELADAGARRYELYRAALARLEEVAPEGEPSDGAVSEGAAPDGAMESAAGAIDEARRRTSSNDWWEGLAAASLGAALSDDLFAALTGRESESGEAKTDAAEGSEPAEPSWPLRRLGDAVRDDPRLAARVSLWSRCLVGEAIVLAREFGGDEYPRLAARLATNHAERMVALGLTE